MKTLHFTALPVSYFLLVACSPIDLKPEQTIDPSPYKAQLINACNNSNQYEDLSKEAKARRCESRTNKTLNTLEQFFNIFQGEKMISKCNKEKLLEQTPCYLAYQKIHYDRAIGEVLNNYSTYSK